MSDSTNTDLFFLNHFVHPLQITWTPQPDITAYELALLLPLLFRFNIMPGELSVLPEECLRHLVVYDPNKED